MRLALGFNPVLPVAEMARLAALAESNGYESLWMHESLFQRDVVTYISAMAASTSRITLGSGVINTFTRHPVSAATAFATLSEVSGGRVTFGFGLGSFPTVPLIGQQIYPVDKTRPLRRIKEYLEVVRALWSGAKVDYEGEVFRVHGLTLGFKPSARIPTFIASLSPLTQAFAGSAADGAILSPALSTVETTKMMVSNVEKGEKRSGRKVERASYMLTSVDADAAAARAAVRDYYFFVYQLAEVVKPESLVPYGVTEEKLKPMKEAWKQGNIPEAKRLIPEESIDALAVAGTPDHAAARIEEYVRAGVTLPILMPIGDARRVVETMSQKK